MARAALIEAAHAAARSKGTYLSAQYRRLAARRGAKKGAVAVGHSILISASHLLRDGEPYHDLGGNSVAARDRLAVERRLVRRLEALGHKVMLEPAACGDLFIPRLLGTTSPDSWLDHTRSRFQIRNIFTGYRTHFCPTLVLR